VPVDVQVTDTHDVTTMTGKFTWFLQKPAAAS
jgi:hypothetical protein